MQEKEVTIDQARMDSFLAWHDKQARTKMDGVNILEMMLVWNDEAPEDEREWSYPVELGEVAGNLEKFLEVYAAEVRRDTLDWVGENIWDRLEQHLEEDPPGVDMASVIKEFEEYADTEEDED